MPKFQFKNSDAPCVHHTFSIILEHFFFSSLRQHCNFLTFIMMATTINNVIINEISSYLTYASYTKVQNGSLTDGVDEWYEEIL